ncbi:MAG: hypothetical protein ACK5Q5_09725 [Planctomycetaceae bacterium]
MKERTISARGCGAVALACLLALQVHAADRVFDSPEQLVEAYLRDTLSIQRLDAPYVMRFHLDCEYPEGRPLAYAIGAAYVHHVSPPNSRCEGSLRAMSPSGEVRTSFENVNNGTADVTLHYDDDGNQNNATVIRGSPDGSPDNGRRNAYLTSVGIPGARHELLRAERGDYFLRAAITAENGYEIGEPESIEGTVCVVVNKGSIDKLWFNVGKRVSLVRRDYWRMHDTVPTRHVFQYSSYERFGLPERVVHTEYHPVTQLGLESKVKGMEIFTLDSLAFESPPDSDFMVEIDPDVDVVDFVSMTTLRTQDPSDEPFEKLIRQNTSISKERRDAANWLIEVNLVMLLLIGIAWLVRRQRARTSTP